MYLLLQVLHLHRRGCMCCHLSSSRIALQNGDETQTHAAWCFECKAQHLLLQLRLQLHGVRALRIVQRQLLLQLLKDAPLFLLYQILEVCCFKVRGKRPAPLPEHVHLQSEKGVGGVMQIEGVLGSFYRLFLGRGQSSGGGFSLEKNIRGLGL
jgi:hypothetical protein